MTIYIDRDCKCYTDSAPGRVAVETNAFAGKCRQYIEGYRYVPVGQTWIREDGQAFNGEMISPWRDYAVLLELQALYEEEQARRADMAAALEAIFAGVTE